MLQPGGILLPLDGRLVSSNPTLRRTEKDCNERRGLLLSTRSEDDHEVVLPTHQHVVVADCCNRRL